MQPSLTPGSPSGPCSMVIFGGSGDLTKRKLLPALLNLAKDHLLAKNFAVLAVARSPFSDEQFRDKIAEDLHQSKLDSALEEQWRWLKPRLFYLAGDSRQIRSREPDTPGGQAEYRRIKGTRDHCVPRRGTWADNPHASRGVRAPRVPRLDVPDGW